jgi:hypothetical protein
VVALLSVLVLMSTHPLVMLVALRVTAPAMALVLSYSCTLSLATAPVPVKLTRTTSCVSSLRPPLATTPVMLPTSSVRLVMLGAVGAVVSMVTV